MRPALGDLKGTFEDFGWQMPKGHFHFHSSGYVSMDVLILSFSKFEASGFLQFFFLTMWSGANVPLFCKLGLLITLNLVTGRIKYKSQH